MKRGNYWLYIDDLRMPKTDQNWIIVRNFEEGVKLVEELGFPAYVSFDHDLGEYGDEKTGYDFAKWLVECDIIHDVMTEDFDFNVHSANPVGAENIEKYIKNYKNFKFKD